MRALSSSHISAYEVTADVDGGIRFDEGATSEVLGSW